MISLSLKIITDGLVSDTIQWKIDELFLPKQLINIEKWSNTLQPMWNLLFVYLLLLWNIDILENGTTKPIECVGKLLTRLSIQKCANIYLEKNQYQISQKWNVNVFVYV